MSNIISRNAAIGVAVCNINIEDRINEIKNLPDAIPERALDKISSALQNYYCMGIAEIAEEDDQLREFFEAVGWL